MMAHTRLRLASTPRIPLVTSHSPDVRKIGSLKLEEVNSAMWLYPAAVGRTSRYAGRPSQVSSKGSGYTDCA